MDERIFSRIISTLIVMGIVIGLLLWGGYELIDWLFIDDAIIVEQPIQPELRIIIKGNTVDTLYIYRKP